MPRPKILTRDEQRRRQTNAQITSLNLDAHLRNLVREIRSGRGDQLANLVEFQQMLRYAPPELCLRLLEHLETSRERAAA